MAALSPLHSCYYASFRWFANHKDNLKQNKMTELKELRNYNPKLFLCQPQK